MMIEYVASDSVGWPSIDLKIWRGTQVVDGNRLESDQAPKRGLVGSNPTLSALSIQERFNFLRWHALH